MKPVLKSIILILLFICSQQIVFAQEEDKIVSILVSGSGKTQDDAKQSALRSAIEQAFGAFISSKTEIFNDQVVADQYASVANGNIKSYSVVNESQLPDGSWGVVLKALVSVSKLTSFVEAKGIAIEINGGLFALNIKQQLLNEQGEINAVSEMVGLLHELMQTSFDYEIKSSTPKSLDLESKNWQMTLEVTATSNKNIDFCANYCIKTLAALSLSTEEVSSYKSLNKSVFRVIINYKGGYNTFFLRNNLSLKVLNIFTSQWEFYTRLFSVEPSSYGNENRDNFNSSILEYDMEYGRIKFLTTNQQAATFTWDVILSLSEIEKMTGFKVNPKGVVSQFKHGGFLVYEENGHGLVAAIADLGKMEWYPGKKACENLVLNGYSDWHLPTKLELDELMNLHRKKIGGFLNKEYWSSTFSDHYPWYINFEFGISNDDGNMNGANIRAVRTF